MATAVLEIQRFRVNRNAWKSNLTIEVIELEDNLDDLFHIVGLKPHRVVTVENSELDDVSIVIPDKRLQNNGPSSKKQKSTSYEAIIDEHFDAIVQATNNICALITSVTEFDLPIPVQLLLRIASRLSLLRWSNYKKKITGSMSRRCVYNKSIGLVLASLKLFKWISVVLGTNTLVFQPYINGNIFTILDWTISSDLEQHNEADFLNLRTQILSLICSMLEVLSTNLCLEPKQLKTLVEQEIIQKLEVTLSKQASMQSTIATKRPLQINGAPAHQTISTSKSPTKVGEASQSVLDDLKAKHSVLALECLEKLFISYASFLDAPLEQRVKSFVIQTCLRIYRDFERNVIGLAVRRQLIKMLETIANQPYASSTTELAWHVFELAQRLESDAEIKFIARRSIKVGLAHRPTIVSYYGVYSSYIGKPMPNALTNGDATMDADVRSGSEDNGGSSGTSVKPVEKEGQQLALEHGGSDGDENLVVQPRTAVKTNGISVVAASEGEQECEEGQGGGKPMLDKKKASLNEETRIEERVADEEKGGKEHIEESGNAMNQDEPGEQKECPEDDPQVQSYLSLFVNKPAS